MMIAALDMSQWGYVIAGWVAMYSAIVVWYVMSRPPLEVPPTLSDKSDISKSDVSEISEK